MREYNGTDVAYSILEWSYSFFFYEVIRFTPQGPQTLVDIQNMEK